MVINRGMIEATDRKIEDEFSSDILVHALDESNNIHACIPVARLAMAWFVGTV